MGNNNCVCVRTYYWDKNINMYYQKRRWSTAKKVNYDGYIYDSKFEAGYAAELDLRVKAKDIKSWEKQVTIPLVVNGYKVCDYRIDFVIHHNDDTTEYVELKGVAFPTWRLKWKLFESLFGDRPGVQLTVIKQRDNFKLRKIKKV